MASPGTGAERANEETETARYYLEERLQIKRANDELRSDISQTERNIALAREDAARMEALLERMRRALEFGLQLEGELRDGPG